MGVRKISLCWGSGEMLIIDENGFLSFTNFLVQLASQLPEEDQSSPFLRF